MTLCLRWSRFPPGAMLDVTLHDDFLAVAAKLHKMVRLSAKMASDAAFARQIKRKFL